MKQILIILLFSFLSISITFSNEFSNGIGIISVLDQRNDMDYSFLFADYLNSNLLKLDNRTIETYLVDHEFRSEWAVRLILENTSEVCYNRVCNSINLQLYHNGELYQTSHLSPSLDSLLLYDSIAFSFQYEGGFNDTGQHFGTITSIDEESNEFKAGLRSGTEFLVSSVDQVNHQVKLWIKLEGSDNWSKLSTPLSLPIYTRFVYAKEILSLDDIYDIFYSAYVVLQTALDKDEQVTKANKVTESNIANYIQARTISEQQKEQIWSSFPGFFDNQLAENIDHQFPLLNSVERFTVYPNRRFTTLKNATPGVAVIINHIHYNRSDFANLFDKEDGISQTFENAVDSYVSPIYRKPAVAINYLLGGDSFAKVNNAPAALNLYRAAYRLTDRINSDIPIKEEIKHALLVRIENCYQQLNQPKTAALMQLTKGMIDFQLTSIQQQVSKFKESSAYYRMADTLSRISRQIEDQIQTKKQEKAKGIFSLIAGASAGVATGSLNDWSDSSLGLASDYLFSGFDAINASLELSNAIDAGISQVTYSIDFPFDANDFKTQDFDSNFKLAATFLRIYQASEDKKAFLEHFSSLLPENSAIRLLLVDFDPQKDWTNNANLRLIKYLISLEEGTKQLEIRGKKVPAEYRI